MLSVEAFSVQYGAVEAVRGIGFSVAAGEVLALIGANGAGKSSVLKGIMGLAHATGSIRLDGCALDGLPSHRRVASGIALSPEGRHVFPDMTVLENLELGHVPRSGQVPGRKVDEMFGLFPRLFERRRQSAGSMSGGEQQMLAIARALMSSPKVLMLDEPSLGLAPMIVELLIVLLQSLKDRGLAVLLAEQNAEMAFEASSRTCVLETGSVVRSGLSADLACDPTVREAYLGL